MAQKTLFSSDGRAPDCSCNLVIRRSLIRIQQQGHIYIYIYIYISIYERRSCMSITENIKKNVIGWFRSISPDPEGSVRFQYATMTRFDICPIRLLQDFSFAYIRHSLHCVHLPIYIIGLFRSTVLRVMSPTRFLCATMMGCHWMVSIHLLWAR